MMKRFAVMTTAALMLLLAACGAKPAVSEAQTFAAKGSVTETLSTQEVTSVEMTAETTQGRTNRQKTTEKQTTVVVSDPTRPVKPTKPGEAPTTVTGTTRTDSFIVKEVHGTVLTLHMYSIEHHDELKSGLYRGDYGGLAGSADMHFKVGDIVTVRFDVDIGETFPFQITIREIYPAQWNTNTGTMITDTFVITKVSGTYLELRKVIYGSDTEKLVYCCDLGNMDGSADMKYKAGDHITMRYDAEIAETYPLRLTVRAIL